GTNTDYLCSSSSPLGPVGYRATHGPYRRRVPHDIYLVEFEPDSAVQLWPSVGTGANARVGPHRHHGGSAGRDYLALHRNQRDRASGGRPEIQCPAGSAVGAGGRGGPHAGRARRATPADGEVPGASPVGGRSRRGGIGGTRRADQYAGWWLVAAFSVCRR